MLTLGLTVAELFSATPADAFWRVSRNPSTVSNAGASPANGEAAGEVTSKPGRLDRLRDNKLFQTLFYAPRDRVGTSETLRSLPEVVTARMGERIASYLFIPPLIVQFTQGSDSGVWVPLQAAGVLTALVGYVVEKDMHAGAGEARMPGFFGTESPIASGLRGFLSGLTPTGIWLNFIAPATYGLQATSDPSANFATWMAIGGAFAGARLVHKVFKNKQRAETTWGTK